MMPNFVAYLRTQFPAETVYQDERKKLSGQTTIPARCILVLDNGGPEEPWIQDAQKMIQVITRDVDAVRARKLAWDIFEDATSRFGLILPAITVGGTVYPAVQVSQIAAVAQPYNMGQDADGRTEYTTNYQIWYRRN